MSTDNLLDWTEMDKGMVISGFSYGYSTTQILGGRLAELYGFKRVFGIALTLCAFLTLASPFVAKQGVWYFIVLRALMGVLEGVSFPSLHAMTARWIPKASRTNFIARSYFGTTLGLVITFPLCGFLIDSFGWESAFYVIGETHFKTLEYCT